MNVKIEILGTGCPKCKALEENAMQAVAESGKIFIKESNPFQHTYSKTIKNYFSKNT